MGEMVEGPHQFRHHLAAGMFRRANNFGGGGGGDQQAAGPGAGARIQSRSSKEKKIGGDQGEVELNCGCDCGEHYRIGIGIERQVVEIVCNYVYPSRQLQISFN